MDVSANFNLSENFRLLTSKDKTGRLWMSAQIHFARQSG